MQGTLSTLIMHCYSVYADPKYTVYLEPKLTIVLVGKDLVLEGLILKMEDKKVPGIYKYLFLSPKETSLLAHPLMASQPTPLAYPHGKEGLIRPYKGKQMVHQPWS